MDVSCPSRVDGCLRNDRSVLHIVFKKNGLQHVSRIELMDTDGQIKRQRRYKDYLTNLILDDGKKSTCFRQRISKGKSDFVSARSSCASRGSDEDRGR